ncbi:MAG: hypothetical protein AB7G13_18040 [Lautropia sp.]
MGAGLPIRRARLADWSREAPQQIDAQGNPSWIVRAAHFVVVATAITGHRPVAALARDGDTEESMLIVPPGVSVLVEAGGERAESVGDTLFILPPGSSRARLRGDGMALQVLSHLARDVCALASNRSDYAGDCADVAPATRWPAPCGGYRLRTYPLARYGGGGNMARVFRSTNLMVNVMSAYEAPRDPRALMPHAHADYEQITLCMAGRFVHHLRAPWLPDSTSWRDDEHLGVESPSALVIPPRLVHTTQAMDRGCRLIDVFGPPRLDFSRVEGLVRNHQEYPMPEETGTAAAAPTQ